MQIDNPDEILDLVNAEDKVIGTILREEVPRLTENKKGFVRAVGVFLINNKNEIWIPTRSLNKKLLPGAYDFSAAGHVTSGQSYIDAAVQETTEELNIQLEPNSFKLVGTLAPLNNVPYFNHIFTVSYNNTPEFNKDDFSKGEWLSVQEIITKIENGHPAKQVILPSLELLKNKAF
jgi:isopentenyldiphosphate isomerase